MRATYSPAVTDASPNFRGRGRGRRLVGRARRRRPAQQGDLRRHRTRRRHLESVGRAHPRRDDRARRCSYPAPVLVGFDFSFGFPAWFAREHGCADDRRRVGARRERRRGVARADARRSGATVATCRPNSASGAARSACARRVPGEVDLPARRQRSGRSRIGPRHAAARAPARRRLRDLAVRRRRRPHRVRDLSEPCCAGAIAHRDAGPYALTARTRRVSCRRS